MNYSLDTTQGPQTSLYSLAPAFGILPVLFCLCYRAAYQPDAVRSSRLTHFIVTPEMSAQTTLCHLPKLLWILTVAVSAEAYTSPGWWK